MSSRVAVVVPTCRGFKVPEQTIPVDWYIVHDGSKYQVDGAAKHILWPDPGMYGHKSSSIRGAGIKQAYEDGAEYIITVDDDCHIPLDWAESHVSAGVDTSVWTNTIEGPKVRGYPDDPTHVHVAITHGVWDGVPDLSGKTQLALQGALYRHRGRFEAIQAPFPMSSMNVGFPALVAPLMYFWPMGDREPFDRYEDIWCGMVAQKVLEHHGCRFVNGGAVVYHKRASDTHANIEKEAPGAEVHENLWKYVWDFDNFGLHIYDSYVRMAYYIEEFRSGREDWDNYFARVARNMRAWVTSLSGLLESSSRRMKIAPSSSEPSGASSKTSMYPPHW